MNESVGSRYYRGRKTILKMLWDRGYIITQEDLAMTLDTFLLKFGDLPKLDKLTILATNNKNDQIFVFFSDGSSSEDDSKGKTDATKKKLGVKHIRSYTTKMESEKVKKAIIVHESGVTPLVKEMLIQMRQKDMDIELFELKRVLINITEHTLVPKHKILSDVEKKEVLDKYKLKETQLPKMQIIDPIARYYGLARGQVVKIERDSETAGKYITYRLVQ